MLTGPRFGPKAGGTPAKLVVLLHGVAADGQDLIGLAPYWADDVPHALFVAPNAPEPSPVNPRGYQWFSLDDFGVAAMSAGAQTAAVALNGFLDGMLDELGLDDGDLALVGFSQGCMMALQVALRRPQACAGVVGYSGMLLNGGALGQEITARPPVMLIHGADDPVVPPQCLGLAEAALTEAQVPVVSHLHANLAHGIDEAGIERGRGFLGERLAAS